jgi:hypothetical protein
MHNILLFAFSYKIYCYTDNIAISKNMFDFINELLEIYPNEVKKIEWHKVYHLYMKLVPLKLG